MQTAHFVVQTNLSSGKAQALAREVERLYEALLHALFKSPPAFPGKVRVVALQSDAEFDLFAPEKAGAFYVRDSLDGPTIVVPGYMDWTQRIIIAHELTHHVAARIFLRQALWFSEGLATYMESIGTSGPGAAPPVGGALKYRLQAVRPWFGGLPALFDRKKARLAEKEYNLAWALLEAGRSGEALPLARAAVALEPWNPAILDTWAAVQDDLGQCAPALAAQQRACDLLGEGFPEAAKKPYLERLADLEKQCGAKPGAPAAPAP